MHYKLVDEKPKTFILVFETNDELARGLRDFVSEQKLASTPDGHLVAGDIIANSHQGLIELNQRLAASSCGLSLKETNVWRL